MFYIFSVLYLKSSIFEVFILFTRPGVAGIRYITSMVNLVPPVKIRKEKENNRITVKTEMRTQ